ncbi:hypothetical protein [Anaerofustis stercorihominis]|uniref:hypothetical protein n=1 Tax=Anaerofustis stercorihominis TaxID=214853 RepID=UPI00214B969E|nr:hypothetical protein [Anaerofustis stercorihominis]MCR2033184.1 hypothetical protein [Anaerofustis stercorihominis]
MISKNDKYLKGKKSIALLLILLLIGFGVVYPNFIADRNVNDSVSITDNKTPLASGKDKSNKADAVSSYSSVINAANNAINSNTVRTNTISRLSADSIMSNPIVKPIQNNNSVSNVSGKDIITSSDSNKEEVKPEVPSDLENEVVTPEQPIIPDNEEETQIPEEPSKPALTAKDGIEWLEKQLSAEGSDLYNYFHGGKGDTFNGSLDSNGYNFAPNVNEALLKEFGLDNMDSITYRIWKDKASGQYNIFWADCGIKNNNNGEAIESTVTKYNTKDKVYIEGTATVKAKNDGNSNLNIIDGSSFKETVKEKSANSIKTIKIAEEKASENSSKADIIKDEKKSDNEQVVETAEASNEEAEAINENTTNKEEVISSENNCEEALAEEPAISEEQSEQAENIAENQNADVVISEME